MNTHTAVPTDPVLPYMHEVDRCDRSVQELSMMCLFGMLDQAQVA